MKMLICGLCFVLDAMMNLFAVLYVSEHYLLIRIFIVVYFSVVLVVVDVILILIVVDVFVVLSENIVLA